MKKKLYFFYFLGVLRAVTENPWVPGTPKCQQMQISSQWRHNVHKGKQLKTSFSYLGQNVYFLAIWGALGGGGGGGGHPLIRLSLSCSQAIISPISMYIWNKGTIWKELLKVKIQNMNKIFFFYIWGVLGDPYVKQPGLPNYQGSKTSSQSRQMYNKENKATRSPEITRQQVQKLTPQFVLYIYWI